MSNLDPYQREKLANLLLDATGSRSLFSDPGDFVYKFKEKLQNSTGSDTWITEIDNWIRTGSHGDGVRSVIKHNMSNPQAIYNYLAQNVKPK